jgi:hypothetical protein
MTEQAFDVPNQDDAQPATLRDLQRLQNELEARFDARFSRMDDRFHELRDHFDASVENIVEQLKGANADDLSSLQDAKRDHDHRLQVLEQRAGLQ